MANQDAAFGFRPVRHLTGGEIRNNTYRITTNYDTALYQGQMVSHKTAGTIETVAANEEYKRKRVKAYPDLGDQLDNLYKDILAGKVDATGEFAKAIKTVKDANPKS